MLFLNVMHLKHYIALIWTPSPGISLARMGGISQVGGIVGRQRKLISSSWKSYAALLPALFYKCFCNLRHVSIKKSTPPCSTDIFVFLKKTFLYERTALLLKWSRSSWILPHPQLSLPLFSLPHWNLQALISAKRLWQVWAILPTVVGGGYWKWQKSCIRRNTQTPHHQHVFLLYFPHSETVFIGTNVPRKHLFIWR